MEIKIKEYKETNNFADASKANNGGGYHQPLIKGSIGDSDFRLHNTHCGDFGPRADLSIDGYDAGYDFITGNNQEWSEIPDRYKLKVSELNKKFHTYFLVESQITDWEGI